MGRQIRLMRPNTLTGDHTQADLVLAGHRGRPAFGRAPLKCENLRHIGVVSDDVDRLGDLIDRIVADLALSGVVLGDISGSAPIQRAYGLAHRGLGISHVVGTQFATKSGSKGLTALTVRVSSSAVNSASTQRRDRCSVTTCPGRRPGAQRFCAAGSGDASNLERIGGQASRSSSHPVRLGQGLSESAGGVGCECLGLGGGHGCCLAVEGDGDGDGDGSFVKHECGEGSAFGSADWALSGERAVADSVDDLKGTSARPVLGEYSLVADLAAKWRTDANIDEDDSW